MISNAKHEHCPTCGARTVPRIEKLSGENAERATVTAEQIIDCLMAEFWYWKEADSKVTIGALSALANVIGFATVDGWRANWHPEK